MFELYAVTDRKMRGDISEVEAARLCYEGGADVVQLRMKDTDGGEMLEKAKAIQEIAQKHCKFFIVNDRLDVAILAGADGVHIGQSDIPVEEARRLVGDEMIIGVSVSTVEEAVKAVEGGADYLGVGAIFNTATKPDADQGIGLRQPDGYLPDGGRTSGGHRRHQQGQHHRGHPCRGRRRGGGLRHHGEARHQGGRP